MTAAIPLGMTETTVSSPEVLLEQMLVDFRAGGEWESVFDVYREALAPAPQTHSPLPDGRTNWLWLTDLGESF